MGGDHYIIYNMMQQLSSTQGYIKCLSEMKKKFSNKKWQKQDSLLQGQAQLSFDKNENLSNKAKSL